MRLQRRYRFKRKELILLIDGVLLATLIFTAIKLISILSAYQQSRRAYAELEQAVAVTPVPATIQPILDIAPTETPVTVPITIDWNALQKRNNEIVAWLYCADTPINYPVTQCRNNDYYLSHNADKQEDAAGALFFDYRNVLFSGMENFIIYGHRRNDLSMFGSLVRFSEKEYVSDHTALYLLTPEKTYRIEPFACRTVRGAEKYFATQFDGESAYVAYISKAVRQSYWTPEIVPDVSDAILTLATCSRYNGVDDAHLLLHGRLTMIQ